ncbi:Tim22-complex subunit TIM54 LALA0_S07e07734g [Lachancea lanzarotensis]|uniref:Mitochondrial import inner membrane translocase subunit TIM54 n=1 Tax=Lachancea lanzarotensis TaxID=1245769 RepID=A0A0C7N5V2_9SACH|nr:uncharacterized protein LALA0_S07e07734g [Lachancea lanzarotensis]CEP63333.1 LALA0S07e07734g1_1 [Lachancea lanzarotensis]
MATSDTPTANAAADVVTKVKKPGYTNPAFKAMGIPPLRIPSRNWMIFWTVLTVSISGIVYDKRQQKKITDKWCKAVEPLSKEKLAFNEKPRKITVFIAPPPSDYLDTSMTVWRRFVKPVLFSSGVDYDVFTEEKQGLIRAEVAERIRKLRRELLDNEAELKRLENERRLWSRCKTAISKGLKYVKAAEELDEEQEKALAVKYKTEFDYRNLLGVYYKNPDRDLNTVDQDALVSDPSMAGGVICIGRGAYKEYIDGVHEGILGPLEPPLKEEAAKIETEIQKSAQEKSEEPLTEPTPVEETVEEKQGAPASADGEETPEAPKPVPQRYIYPNEYSDANFPSELSTSKVIRELESQTPAIYLQPILVLPMPNLSGFLNIPERIYRFYRTRYVADSFCKATTSCVLQKVRPFSSSIDLNLAVAEEADWPKKWVEQGKEKGSEWVSELKGDDRVLNLLNVFESSMVDE